MYLGVDGGGTKTALVLIDREGAVRATHVTSGAYYLTLGLEALGAQLCAAVGTVLEKAGARADQVNFAFFGLPAYGEDSSVQAELDQIAAPCLREGSYLCGNDMICGWAGSLLCRDGVSVVAGTGSICYGERGGVTARSGGWGELFSDEGSAYWIACRGLNLFSRMSDGRATRGPFYDFFKQRLPMDSDLDLCAHVYTKLGGDRALIAQLSRLVTQAAAGGDAQASFILDEAASALALMVDATRRQLGFSVDDSVAVSYSGGVFDNAGAMLAQRFSVSLLALAPGYRVGEPLLSPAIGAALYAAKRHGRPLSDAAIQRLRAHAAADRGQLR